MSSRSLNIVYFGADASWKDLQGIGFRRRNTCLLREFALHPQVERLVVVTPTVRGHGFRRRSFWQSLFAPGRSEKVRDVFVFAFIPGQRWLQTIRRANRLLSRWLIRRSVVVGKTSRTVEWCYWPFGYELAQEFGLDSPLVFDADNDILNCPALVTERNRIAKLVDDCARHADAVVCGSRQFLARGQDPRFKRPTFLRNGVDLDRFREIADEPEDLKHIPRPRLGFVGTLSEWVDYSLLLELGRLNPNWSIVLIGDEYRTEVPPQLKATPSAWFLGSRKANRIPAYLQHFDVGIVPYRQGVGNGSDGDSMKIFEYLAAGLPVVATDYHGRVIEDFEGLVMTAADKTSFVGAVQHALSETVADSERRKVRQLAFLQRNTWHRRAEEAMALMQELVS